MLSIWYQILSSRYFQEVVFNRKITFLTRQNKLPENDVNPAITRYRRTRVYDLFFVYMDFNCVLLWRQ